jgi:prepilin-type N-terminal cleavage/methylation domain-containing protein
MTRGFSLIELSASLVIIAFIIAAISTGATLVRQSEIRATIAEMQQYRTAFTEFKKRYNAIPGDMKDATIFWTTTCATTITCNGDGDGIVEAIHGSSSDETARAWKHLDLSDLINKSIDIIPAAYLGVITIGELSPAGKLEGTGYFIAAGGDIGGDTVGTIMTSPWTDNRTNAVFLGRKGNSSTSNGLVYGAMTARDAYQIDIKIDDGKQNASNTAQGWSTGKIRARNSYDFATTCIAGSAYVTSSNDEACIVGYQLHDR